MTFWLYKPEAYFDVAWRREPGAGPILINLIHDVDTIRYLCGEIATVQATSASGVRGMRVEDTAAALLRFHSGAIGTVTASDAIAAPWSWELTAAENPAYPATGESSLLIGGTEGSLSLPDLGLWRYGAERSWMEPIAREALISGRGDPLVTQLRHFADVVRGVASPLVSAGDGLRTVKAVEAILRAAESGRLVEID